MNSKYNYKKGLLDGIPVCLAYFAVSFTFGAKMVTSGFSPFFATLISATNLTSAGQFAGADMMIEGAFFLEVFLAIFVINARYILMSLSLSQNLPEKTGTLKRVVMSMFVTDEIFALGNASGKNLNFKYFLGLGTLPYIGWSLGTLLGGLVTNLLPQSLQLALEIAIYCMFISIIIPPAKKSKAITFSIAVSIAISCLIYYVPILNRLSSGVRVIISAIISSVLTAIIFPIKEEKEDKESENTLEVQKGDNNG